MVKKSAALLLVIIISLFTLAACGGAQDTSQVDEAVPERPSEPAEVNGDYRPDSPEHIGTTGKPQLIEFFAYWCTTCRGMKPTVHQLEADYWGEIDFVYLDIDDPINADAMDAYGFAAQPLFVLVDADGNELASWYGIVDADEFKTAFDEVLN